MTTSPLAPAKRALEVNIPGLPYPIPEAPYFKIGRRDAGSEPRRRKERRQSVDSPVTNCPTAIPIYASACTSSGTSFAYASACSCAGVAKVYTTLPSPVLTMVVTSTATTPVETSKVVPMATNTVSPPFIIRVDNTGTDYVNVYAMSGYSLLRYESISSASAARFEILNGKLYRADGSENIVTPTGGGEQCLFYGVNGQVSQANLQSLPASFGNFDAAAGGFALNIDYGFGRVLRAATNNDNLLLAGQPISNYSPVPQIYAVFI